MGVGGASFEGGDVVVGSVGVGSWGVSPPADTEDDDGVLGIRGLALGLGLEGGMGRGLVSLVGMAVVSAATAIAVVTAVGGSRPD